jgi:hypothetical protein
MIVYASTYANMRTPFVFLLFASKAAVCTVHIAECVNVRTSSPDISQADCRFG